MRGVVAAAHFDASRNYVAILGGLRRYILASPKNCEFMYEYLTPFKIMCIWMYVCRRLYPSNHPSGRHSEIDWSRPDLEKFPEFEGARVSEVILGAGDVLYIPSGWIHYIESLNINWQCNARSGKGKGRIFDLDRCGF